MRATSLLVAAAVGLCVGTWLAWSGWRQPRPSPATVLERLHRSPAGWPGSSPITKTGSPFGLVGRMFLGRDLRARLTGWEQPLALIGRPMEVHVGLLSTASAAGLVVPVVALTMASRLGLVPIGVGIPAAISLACAVVVPLVLHGGAIARADTVRVDLRHQLAAYLDMVTMLLAGNSGYEGALENAAGAGDGLLFRQLRRRMREVAATGTSLVSALSLVARDFGMPELEQVAATTALSAAEGAPVARTLAAKCATLRSTLAGDEETAARIRTDKVTPPLVGMALLFMALIVYPALSFH